MNTTAVRVRRRRSIPLVYWGTRLLVGAAVTAALVLMVLSRTRPDLIQDLRAIGDSALAPVLDLASRPIGFLASLRDDASSYFAVRRRNLELETRLGDFVTLERTVERLSAENDRLRAQLSVSEWPARILATGRVIGAGSGPFLHSVLIDAGSRAGVGSRVAVVDKSGVVGRTISVGPLVARVLLLTDLNSRIPVRIERTGDTAILVGDNSGTPQIQFLPIGAEIAVGDRVVTSGHGGVFPPDLPVGIVSAASDDMVRLLPFAELGRMSFLTVVSLPDTTETDEDSAVAADDAATTQESQR